MPRRNLQRLRLLTALTALAAIALVGAGCDGAFDPQGPRSEPIADLWWGMLIMASVVSVAVIALLLIAVVVAQRRDRTLQSTGRGLIGMIVGGGVILPLVVAWVLTAWGLSVDRTVLAEGEDDLVIEVVGHRWWWGVRYPAEGIVTANEIHIPTNRSVRVELTSNDIIHAFWVPQLGGKADLIPGRTNQIFIDSREPGRFRGQCAEYCGLQHAQMRLFVVAQHPEDFDAWVSDQQSPAELVEDDDLFELGRSTFLTAGCASCHAISGHPGARGRVGPDLTHLMSRETIAAGTLPNTRGNLAGWVLDPQAQKPGALMPATQLTADQLEAILEYLESLE